MLIVQILVATLIPIAMIITYFFCKKKNIAMPNKLFKILSLVLAGIFIFRYMLSTEPIRNVFKLDNSPYSSSLVTVLMLILNWFSYASMLGIILYPFFKSKGYLLIVRWFCIPVIVTSLFCIYPLSLAVEAEAYVGFKLVTFLLGVEVGVALAYGVILYMETKSETFERHDYKCLLYIIGMLLATMPAYMFQGLLGFVNIANVKDLTPIHRLLLYGAFIIPIALFLILRKRDRNTIKLCLLYISLGTLLTFSLQHKFDTFLNPTGWPLHLCNTAMYIIPLCLIFKWNKLFYFTYFINVFGAFLAMVMPNYSDASTLLSTSMTVFYINHYIAFFMPLLIVALKVYPRPKLREFKYSMLGFLIYFVIVLICNAWFSNYGTVDYFFINSDFIADKLGKWAEDLRKVVLEFSINDLKFVLYPLYQALFFLCYVVLGAGMWFVYVGAYSLVDTIFDIIARNGKIKVDRLILESNLNGRGIEEPMNVENKDKLILRNFSKRYGKSDVYAVKGANLEIKGGEIFGFLGHNGAGKSTIIKSIVGIQPITSGDIEVCGYDVNKQSTQAKRHIGFVPDHYALYEKLTGREYINYIADLYKVTLDDRNKCIKKYVEIFELGDAFDNQIKTYSHGMKQKIAIMSALVHNPKVWILDEPLTGLDPTSIFQVKKCMKEHAKAGNIVFFSSHLIDIVESLCDRIAIIKKGQILTVENVNEIEKKMPLEEYYLQVTKTDVSSVKVNKTDEGDVSTIRELSDDEIAKNKKEKKRLEKLEKKKQLKKEKSKK